MNTTLVIFLILLSTAVIYWVVVGEKKHKELFT